MKRLRTPYICEQCGNVFFPFPSSKAKRFCSLKCYSTWDSSRPLADRFFEKLHKLDSGCWSIGSGHDRMYSKMLFQGKQLHGHCISWMIHKGAIPDGLCVCHNCPAGDNRWCVNPDHLFLGTRAENTFDMHRKGRQHMILNEAMVAAIRKDFASGTSRAKLREKYTISKTTVRDIVLRLRWEI